MRAAAVALFIAMVLSLVCAWQLAGYMDHEAKKYWARQLVNEQLFNVKTANEIISLHFRGEPLSVNPTTIPAPGWEGVASHVLGYAWISPWVAVAIPPTTIACAACILLFLSKRTLEPAMTPTR
jgi:hypothetical protein